MLELYLFIGWCAICTILAALWYDSADGVRPSTREHLRIKTCSQSISWEHYDIANTSGY